MEIKLSQCGLVYRFGTHQSKDPEADTSQLYAKRGAGSTAVFKSSEPVGFFCVVSVLYNYVANEPT